MRIPILLVTPEHVRGDGDFVVSGVNFACEKGFKGCV